MKRYLLPLFPLLLTLALSGCGDTQPKIPAPEQSGIIRDLVQYPQDLNAYVQSSAPLLSPAQSREQAERFARIYFAPWRQTKPTKGNLEYFRGELNRGPGKRGYAENLLPWDGQRWQNLSDNADLGRYPSFMAAAITVRPTDARLAPGLSPSFSHPTDPGQGFPFDNFQQTRLPLGLPLLLTHISRDGAWFLVESSIAGGWVQAQDVALAGADFRARWENGNYGVVVRDELSLSNGSTFVSYAHIGTVLPQVAGGVLLPLRRADGQAQAVTASVPAGAVVSMPQPLTEKAFAALGNQIMGQPYGWGGYLDNRDCSSTMRDLYAPFGLWLPRNSASQVKSGEFVSFSGLNAEERKALIVRKGVPFMTLLYMPGHIGLYIGQKDGVPMYFHNMWGVRLDQGQGMPQGRFIIGRAAVTTTEPGKELPNVTGILINRMTGMAILGR